MNKALVLVITLGLDFLNVFSRFYIPLIYLSMFFGPTVLLETAVFRLTIRLNCHVCKEIYKIQSIPMLHISVSSPDFLNNCRSCRKLASSMKFSYSEDANVNSRDNEFANTISIWDNFPCPDNSSSCKNPNFSPLVV